MAHYRRPPKGARVADMATRHGKALALSLLNQALSSGANFLLGLYLVRKLSSADFGLFGIASAFVHLYLAVGNAVLLRQMIVHLPEKAPQDREHYATRILFLLLGGSLVLGAVAGLVAVFVGLTPLKAIERSPSFVMLVAAAGTCSMLRDFFIQYAYSRRQEGSALLVNTVVGLSLTVLLLGAHVLPYALSVQSALSIFALAQLIGALSGLAHSSMPLSRRNFSNAAADLPEVWNGGKWGLGTALGTWVQTQAYSFVALAHLGPADLGRIYAARLLLSPFFLLLPAIGIWVLPRLASLRACDSKRAVKVGTWIALATTGAAVAYSAFVLTFASRLAPLVLGPKYSGLSTLIGGWCFYTIVTTFREGGSTLLVSLKRFRLATLAQLPAIAVSVAGTWALCRTYGPLGAILGIALGESVFAVLAWLAVRFSDAQSERVRTDTPGEMRPISSGSDWC